MTSDGAAGGARGPAGAGAHHARGASRSEAPQPVGLAILVGQHMLVFYRSRVSA